MNYFFEKLSKILGILINRGIFELLKRFQDYIHHHLRDKWRFIYFELNLTEVNYSLPEMDESLVVKRAKHGDIKKIQDDMYPFMTTKQEFDKRYIEQIGDDGFECFVAEKNGKVVHYFMVFNNALNSPLIQTPFDEKKILPNDAYLGSAFTVPEARGIWIVPHVLLSIISYFHDKENMQRALLLVHEDTPGAVGFFKRLGFSVINNASPKNLFDAWFK